MNALPWRPPSTINGSDSDWSIARLRAFSYVIGVLLKGDGSVYTTHETKISGGIPREYIVHRVELKNNSSAFMKAFNHDCSVVLGRRPVKVHGPCADGHNILQYRSKEFASWWFRQSLMELREFIEAFPVEYLRGRYDSDCYVDRYRVDLCGAESQRDVMEFERALCMKLGIRVGKIRPYGKPGEVFTIGAKKIISRQQKLRLSANTGDFRRVVQYLHVEWRNEKLQTALRRRRWTPWPSVVRDSAKELHDKFGWNCKRIATELQHKYGHPIPSITVYFWLNRGTRSWEEHQHRSSA